MNQAKAQPKTEKKIKKVLPKKKELKNTKSLEGIGGIGSGAAAAEFQLTQGCPASITL